jgi:integrase/recombinase XerD
MIIYKTTMQFIKVTNKYLKKVCTHLGITKNCTTYFARHSYSKAMLDSGANIAYISNSLGHKKIATTQNYLNSFDDYNKHSMASKALLNFPV